MAAKFARQLPLLVLIVELSSSQAQLSSSTQQHQQQEQEQQEEEEGACQEPAVRGSALIQSMTSRSRLAVAALHEDLQQRAASPQRLQVVSMIMTAPESFEKRRIIRSTLRELTSGVAMGDLGADVIVRFAIGNKYPDWTEAKQRNITDMLLSESSSYGDLAILNISDASLVAWSDFETPYSDYIPVPVWYVPGYCDTGKTWHLFQWALTQFPSADLIFKQDDDAIVDWRVALTRFAGRALPQGNLSSSSQLPSLFLGRQHSYSGILAFNYQTTCANGELYGFSRDVVSWIGENTHSLVGAEDLRACEWADLFDRSHPQDPINRHGILEPGQGPDGYCGAWVHMVKTDEQYLACYQDRVNGCTTTDHNVCWSHSWGECQDPSMGEGIFDNNTQHWKLP